MGGTGEACKPSPHRLPPQAPLPLPCPHGPPKPASPGEKGPGRGLPSTLGLFFFWGGAPEVQRLVVLATAGNQENRGRSASAVLTKGSFSFYFFLFLKCFLLLALHVARRQKLIFRNGSK